MKTIEIIEQKPTSTLELYDTPWQEYLRQKNYNTDPRKMCLECQKEQIRKYGEITIKCAGPKDLSMFDKEILDSLNEEELAQLEEDVNPYEWALKNIDPDEVDPGRKLFVRRWYQEMQTLCSAPRKVIRCGRRAGKTHGLAADIVNRLIKIPNYQVLVVTPYLSQAKEISNTVRKMIRSMDEEKTGGWNEIVTRSVTAPNHEIVLSNGATYKAFTSGGKEAASIRGQGADLIVLDEADYLTPGATDAILAILMDKPNTELICTSTPNGEGLLWSMAKQPDYKEFHFPSFVIPHYNDELDQDNRRRHSVMGYIQEIMAEFGMDNNAVFQSEMINRAVEIDIGADIATVLTNRHDYILSLGCDWNADKVGTRICILAYSKPEDRFFILHIDNVKKEGWTQVMAVERIVELNRMFIPDYIYVDEGFGEANVQSIKLVAMNSMGKVPKDHPDLKLARVVPINFASTLELTDAFTGEVRKKYFKNFLVETAKRALEDGRLSLKSEISEGVVEQMRNYIIDKVISGNREIYKPRIKEVGDHDLDAFMLALCAIHMNHQSILDVGRVSQPVILGVDREKSASYSDKSNISKREEPQVSSSRRVKSMFSRTWDSDGRSGMRNFLSGYKKNIKRTF